MAGTASAGFLLGAPLPGLDGLAAHGAGPVGHVQLEVEAAGIADRLLALVPSP